MTIARSLLVLTLLLAGCQRTLFESVPSSNASRCDADLVGRWLSVDDNAANNGELQADVSARCELQVIERRSEGSRESATTRLVTSRLDRTKVLLVNATWANASFDIEAGPLDHAEDFYMYAYRLRGGTRLTLLPVKHRRLADRAVANRLKADVLLLDGSLTVRVRGDADAMSKALQRLNLFDTSESLNFVRAKATTPP